jgi:hypothetical protein
VPSIWSRVLDRTVSVRSMPSSASSDRGFGGEEGIEPLELRDATPDENPLFLSGILSTREKEILLQ